MEMLKKHFKTSGDKNLLKLFSYHMDCCNQCFGSRSDIGSVFEDLVEPRGEARRPSRPLPPDVKNYLNFRVKK